MKKLVQIVSEVKINIEQQDLEQMILDRIAAENPQVTVEAIEFIQRRDPTRTEVNVKAHLGDIQTPLAEKLTVTEEAEPALEMEPESATVGDIFGGE